MQNSWLRIAFFLGIFSFTASLYAQKNTNELNLEKYWNYRDRLSRYFVKVGPEVGESVVAYVRNRNRSAKRGFTVSDQTIDLAWYIGILATEYQLLNENHQNTTETLQELYYALMAFDRLDRCETYPPWNRPKDTLDGFFHRYDITLEFHPEQFSIIGRNKGLNSTNKWGSRPPGVPTYISGYDSDGRPNPYAAEVSQDQLIHLLMGFSLVYKCLPDTELKVYDNHIKEHLVNFNHQAQLLIDRVLRLLLRDKHWIIKNPDGQNVERGQNALMYAYPLAAVGKKINGKSYNDLWSQSYIAKKMWDLSRMPNWVNDFNSTMALTLAAISDSWWDFTPLGYINNTGFYIAKCGQVWNRETFYLLLYQVLQNKRTKWYDKEKVLQQINTAPFNGPYYWSQDSVFFDCCGTQAGKPEGGWAYPNKFRGTKKEQEGLGKYPTTGNFSGIDYLLLYNLYHLVERPIPYRRE